MVRRINHILIALFLLSFSLPAQQTKEIKVQNLKLTQLHKEISSLQNKLTEKFKKEKVSLGALEIINQQTHLITEYIIMLKKTEKRAEKKIKRLNVQISKMKKKIHKLRAVYSNYIIWIYKYGKTPKLNLLLNSKSLNEALLRYKYLSLITKENLITLRDLKNEIKKYTFLKAEQQKEVDKKRILIALKKNEKLDLIKKKKEKEKLISKLKKDRTAILTEINRKRNAEIKIKDKIVELIEKERKRLAKLEEEKFKKNQPIAVSSYNYSNFTNFAKLKGKLKWPVIYGRISRKFGEVENAKLKTVTLNYGIDIKTKTGANVYAVAQGIVSAIDWIPGYGSVVIITHKNNFRTVYGHLADIDVSEGDYVKLGTVLGKVNESLEGYILHFEIWDERNYKNPMKWLVRK